MSAKRKKWRVEIRYADGSRRYPTGVTSERRAYDRVMEAKHLRQIGQSDAVRIVVWVDERLGAGWERFDEQPVPEVSS
jgi:hypothetical protein